jgi:hypothetical protein
MELEVTPGVVGGIDGPGVPMLVGVELGVGMDVVAMARDGVALGATDVVALVSDGAGVLTDVVGVVSELAGAVTEVPGVVTELEGAVTEVAGAVTELAGVVTALAGVVVTERAGVVTELAGAVADGAALGDCRCGAVVTATCAKAALLATIKLSVASSPAATQADRRCVLSVSMAQNLCQSRGNARCRTLFRRTRGALAAS